MAPAGGSNLCGEVCPVRVVARFRPPVSEEEQEENPAFTVNAAGVVESADHLHCFRLDSAFGQETSQQQVYEDVGRRVVQDVLSGYNGTILAYGPTGSGKTFCMFGPPQGRSPGDLEGLVPRAVEQVLQHVQESGGTKLQCSFFEVYLDRVRDFLSPKTPNPQLKEFPGGVEGLTYKEISTAAEALQILRLGLRLRVAANTSLNEHSSRSHAIFSLLLRQTQQSGIRVCKLTLVDLAGSEKVRKSGSVGGMLEEAKKINSSLSALGHVIEALSERRPHVPYRDSRLTRLLEESLGGNCRTTLLVACSSSSIHASETLSSLRFAVRARKVENSVGVTVSSPHQSSQSSDRQLERRIAQLRRELARLESRRSVSRSLSADRRMSSRSTVAKSMSTSSLSPERPRSSRISPAAGAMKDNKADKATSHAGQSHLDVPEALPICNSVTLLGSCRSTADPGSGVSSTCSVAAVSTGSAAGTPLSRDRDATAREESPCPPTTRGSYSFLIEATPLADMPVTLKGWTANQSSVQILCGDTDISEVKPLGIEGGRPPMATEMSGRCRELERQLEAERRQHALELESLQRQHIEGRLQALTSLSPVSTAPGASRLAALAKSVPCSNVESIARTQSSEGLKLSARNDEAWPARFAPPLVGPSCLAPVLPCSHPSRAPRASPVLSQEASRDVKQSQIELGGRWAYFRRACRNGQATVALTSLSSAAPHAPKCQAEAARLGKSQILGCAVGTPPPLPRMPSVMINICRREARVVSEAKDWKDEAILVPHECIRWWNSNLLEILADFEPVKRPTSAWKTKVLMDFLENYYLPCVHHHHRSEEEIYNPGILEKCKSMGVADPFPKVKKDHETLVALLDKVVTFRKPIESGDAKAVEEFKAAMKEMIKFMEEHLAEEEQDYPKIFADCQLTQEEEGVLLNKILEGLGLDGSKRFLPPIMYAMVLWRGKDKMMEWEAKLPGPIRMLNSNCWLNDFHENQLRVLEALKKEEAFEPHAPSCNLCSVM
ncbi:kif3 [Symbiodinium sp. CCMP2456]|nr:kif3 [Symbiodinium sp. CCMP2456]